MVHSLTSRPMWRGVAAVLAALAVLGALVWWPAENGGEVRAQEPEAAEDDDVVKDVVFAIHGGAGTLRRDDFPADLEAEFRDALGDALRRGSEMLEGGGDGVDAVEAAITSMEDSELFNAGKGAVFTTDAANELDASIMDGETLDAGAVTGVTHIKNPISLARTLMDDSRHVLLAGQGAELFAQDKGFDLVTQDYFFTQNRWDSLLAAKDGSNEFNFGEEGTVGAVALDDDDNLAAGTSTGGLTNKPVGRIGDSPIVGAGTYADNDTAAVSATGTGELFIRQAAAARVSAVMEYGNRKVGAAAQEAIDEVAEIGGPDSGGLIALDSRGNFAMPFNTEGMFRGYVTEDGEIVVKIFGDE